MSLTEIKRYLMQVKTSSLTGLALYFNCDQEVLRGMLTHWIRKGMICRLTSGCGSCTKQCGLAPKATEWYQWVSPIAK